MKANYNLLAMALVVTLGGAPMGAQTFNSGSNGSDGALNFTGQTGTVVFNPASFNPALDPDHDNVYHFTTITIPNDLTVRLTASTLGVKPVVWLATGDVQISGTLSLSGESGHSTVTAAVTAVAGAGGYSGGAGGTSTSSWQPGQGPGGARGAGGGAGHVVPGTGADEGLNGMAYGNDFLIPMIGGSGGAGGLFTSVRGSGAGGGGGAIVIASSTSITVSGSINADGGTGGHGGGGPLAEANAGGGGSGGAIRLIAPRIRSTQPGSSLFARGGFKGAGSNRASQGRIRLETFRNEFTSTADPGPLVVTPGPVFPPASAPFVRITSIGGVAVPANPTASFVMPDVTLDNAASVTIQLEAAKVPLGTVVRLTLTPETGTIVTVDSTPLAGTFESSTATATATIPHGFSRFSVQASWTP